MSTLQSRFEHQYGVGNAHVHNSALFNMEPVAADRYTGMKTELETQLQAGKDIDVYLLSLGAAESFQVLDTIESLDQYTDKLHFYYISPTAPKTRMDSLKYIAKFSKIVGQESAVFPRPVPGKRRLLRGIMSFATIPPEDFAENAQLYTEGIRDATKELSQVRDGTSVIPLTPPDPEINYLNKLFTPDEKDTIRELDGDLRSAIENHERREVRTLLQRRARMTWSKMSGIYGGKYAKDMGDTPREKSSIKSSREGRQVKRKLLADTYWRTNVHEKLEAMAESEMHMTFVVPEFDILYTREEAEELASKGPNVEVYVAELTTHGFPWGSRAETTLSVSGQHPEAA
jgi:hypothetical protein